MQNMCACVQYIPAACGWYSNCGNRKHVSTYICTGNGIESTKTTRINYFCGNCIRIHQASTIVNLPVHLSSHRCPFEMLAAAVLDSPITKPLSISNWPMCTADIVADYPIRPTHVAHCNCPIRSVSLLVYYRADWAHPTMHNYQFHLVSTPMHSDRHSNCLIWSIDRCSTASRWENSRLK